MTAAPLDPETERQLAAAFVAELIICRRVIQSYPESHPSITAKLGKVINRLAPLVAGGGTLTLGITRDGLILNKEFLESANAKFGEYANILASFGIIAISFTEALQPEELRAFNRIVNTPRNEIWEAGGIVPALSDAGIHAIKVQAIDPSVFILTDEIGPKSADEPVDPWETFVHRLLEGHFSMSREKLALLLVAQPSELAREFDVILAGIHEEARRQTLKAMADFFTGLTHRQGIEALHEDTLDKICAFIAGLSPEIRADFILNVCRSTETTTGFSERLIQRLPGDELRRVMESVATHGENIPEVVLKLMQRLSSHSASTAELDSAIISEGAEKKVQVLFRNADLENFVPTDYQELLLAILTTDSMPDAEHHALSDLRATLDPDQMEAKVADIITEILKVVPLEEQGDGIRRNLVDMASYFLRNADFNSLSRVCSILLDKDKEAGEGTFIDPGFTQKVLDAVTILGREYHPEIRSIIRSVGRPFVAPLIDRLAEEENRSLRRFWYDCLGDLGDVVRDAALERLNDERWYVVRNLLILLRNFSDPEVLRQVRRLTGNRNIRIRSEALRSLLRYRDSNADRLLLQELASPDPARKLAAVQIAEMSRDPEVANRLLDMVDTRGFKVFSLEIKSAAVQSLAVGNNALALSKFITILHSTSLFNARKLKQLKIDIIRTLPHFPVAQVRPLLQELAVSGGKALAPVAEETLKRIQGGAP